MDAEWSTAMSNSFGSFQDTAKVYLYDGANFDDSTFTDMYNTMVNDNAGPRVQHAAGAAPRSTAARRRR